MLAHMSKQMSVFGLNAVWIGPMEEDTQKIDLDVVGKRLREELSAPDPALTSKMLALLSALQKSEARIAQEQ